MLFFIVGFVGYGQEKEVTLGVAKHQDVLIPGKHYTLFFSISNHSEKQKNLTGVLELPSEFKLLLKPKKIIVKPSETVRQMMLIKVDKMCSSGDFSVYFSVVENGKKIEQLKVAFKVLPVRKFEVELLESPRYLRDEKDFICTYRVKNLGNQTEEVRFESRKALEVYPNTAVLKADSIVIVKVKQRVPEIYGVRSTVLNNLHVQLLSEDLVFSDRVAVTVYPKGVHKPDLYHRFPVSFSSVYNYLKGLDTVSFVKYKVSGNGFLDVKEKHYLSFDYSGPNQIEVPRFGEYEYYSVAYRNKWMEASVGDVNFSLSSMTENSRAGRGLVFMFKTKKSEWTTFFVRPRFTSQISNVYGFKGAYYLTEKVRIKGGFMTRSLHENELIFNSNLYSLEGLGSFNAVKVSAELAFESNPYSHGWAGASSLNYQYKKIDIGSNIQYSDKNFKGYLRNSKQWLGFARWQLSNKLKFSGSVYQSDINPVKDTINYSSFPRVKKYQLGFGYKINEKHKVKLSGYFRKKEDQQKPASFEFEEQLLSATYQYKHKNKLAVVWRNKFGISTNFLADIVASKKVFFSTGDVRYNVFHNLILGLNATYQSTNKNALDNALIKSFYYGGNLQYYFKNSLELSLFYKNDYDFDEFTEEQSFLELSLNYNYQQQHKLSLSTSVSSLSADTNQKELFLSASYTYVLKAPLSKNKSVGSISGVVADKEGVKYEGVLVFLEDKIAISDAKGRFYFYNLQPNEYLVFIKQSSLPKNKVLISEMPLVLDVIANKELTIDVQLGNAGSVEGRVVFKRSKEIQSEKFIKKLPKIVVKIYKGSKKFLTEMDKKGYFYFNELEPGVWTVELLVKGLTKDFYFEHIKKTCVIKSGDRKQLLFQVTNKKRVLRKSKKKFKL